MPGPAALIALAARLGIPKAASLTYKQLQKLVAKAQKKKTKQQKTSEKKFTGKGPERKQEKVIQRKKPKIDSDLAIKKKKATKLLKQANLKSFREYDRKSGLTDKYHLIQNSLIKKVEPYRKDLIYDTLVKGSESVKGKFQGGWSKITYKAYKTKPDGTLSDNFVLKSFFTHK